MAIVSHLATNSLCALVVALSENQVTFNMAIGNVQRTRAREFSQTLAHGNSKNEIRQRNRSER